MISDPLDRSALLRQCSQCAKLCLDGCPAESYAALSALLAAVAKEAARMDAAQLAVFNQIMRRCLDGQQINDLLLIHDTLMAGLYPLIADLKD